MSDQVQCDAMAADDSLRFTRFYRCPLPAKVGTTAALQAAAGLLIREPDDTGPFHVCFNHFRTLAQGHWVTRFQEHRL